MISSQGTGFTTEQNWVNDIDIVLEELSNCEGIIIDVRNNTGGLGQNGQALAGRFTQTKKEVYKVRTKNGKRRQDFGPYTKFYIVPTGKQWTKPVVLLTNQLTISAGELFSLCMLAGENVVHVGTRTNGVFSLSINRDLPNRWVYRLSVQQLVLANGTILEGSGVHPKPENVIHNTESDKQNNLDPQLDFAVHKFVK